MQDQDGKISLQDFLEGAKADSTIVKALTIYDGLLWALLHIIGTIHYNFNTLNSIIYHNNFT